MKKLILYFFTILYSLNFFSCRDMIHDISAISAPTVKLKSLNMISLPDTTAPDYDLNTNIDLKNLNSSGLKPYKINAYETTYILWYEIYEWGKNNDFNFIKKAKAGDYQISTPGKHAYLPVTSAHPADVIVWLNALSCKNGLTPVYYTDAEFQNILRDSELISNFKEIDEFGAPLTDMNGNPIKQYDYSIKSNFYTNLSANGYRLPTKEEWKFAAQGAWRTNSDKYYLYSGSNDYKEVASLKYLRTPGQYKPNAIGTYDMTGNVAEITLNETNYECHGCHYNMDKDTGNLQNNFRSLHHIYGNWPEIFGFRIAQTLNL